MRLLAYLIIAVVLTAQFLYLKGKNERCPRRHPRPVPVATPEPVNMLEWRAPIPSQHVPERTFVTF